jgi:phosphatidylglycerol:prolipoprotein diacylglycerol transferase
MINFLHTFKPEAILISLDPITIYWYGLFVVSGILAAFFVILKLATYYKIDKNKIIDLGFWVIIIGIIGARIYHVGLELPYYLENPLNIFKIWNGGLAIHGGIIAGGLSSLYLVKKYKLKFWKVTALATTGLALGQAIGRWGNYFNQELYGLPTSTAWGIPIEEANRVLGYKTFEFFHPTFLYESIGNLIIFIILISLHIFIIKKEKIQKTSFINLTLLYLVLYSILRFSLEFIRIDYTPYLAGMRFPQIISLIIIFLSFCFFCYNLHKQKKKDLIKN